MERLNIETSTKLDKAIFRIIQREEKEAVKTEANLIYLRF